MTSGLSKNGHVYAIFDYDVYEDKQRIDGKAFDEFYKENKDIVFWFNFTPEKFIIENIKYNDDSHYEFLQKLKMEMNTVAYTEIKGGTERDNGRGLAKKQLEYLIRKVKSKPGESEDETSNIICDIVVKNMADNDLNSLFNRLFK